MPMAMDALHDLQRAKALAAGYLGRGGGGALGRSEKHMQARRKQLAADADDPHRVQPENEARCALLRFLGRLCGSLHCVGANAGSWSDCP